jgi:4-hydroxybenzoate polyprenyltransferase
MKQKLQPYIQLMRLDRPIGTFLLLWPTWWALWLTGQPTLYLVMIFTLGVCVMRSAGCVINDFADRKVDGLVTRTKTRPLANYRISEKQAKLLFVVLITLAFLLVLCLNRLTLLLAFFALASAMIYPFMKRYTHLPQLFLGIAFSWGIPMAYASAIGKFPVTCWLLCLVNICWTIAYDTEYAMVDREDDLKVGIKSTAILFGLYDKLIIGLLQVITIIILFFIGWLNQLGHGYMMLVFIAGGLFVYQQYLIHDRVPERCFSAFMNNNYVGLIIFIGIVINDYF